ncbi:hypothetical protein AB0H83_14155 [Dactylosporangium sp. NPDC050688]|uniref:ATP-grasp domain-containing protein n=1 Tax=Dactylosporangium sp. NPDC050688 TaxID=3157217 RepID=UPI0033F0CAB7
MSGNEPSALLIGADPYAIRAFLRNGITPVVLHSPQNNWGLFVNDWSHAPIPDSAELIFAEDPDNLESLLFSLHRAGAADRDYRCVQTNSEHGLVAAAALANILGIRGPAPRTAVNFRDKWLQKQIVAAAGVTVARSRVVEDVYAPDPDAFTGFDVAVLKPIAGGGTRNTSVVRSTEEFLATCAEYRRRRLPTRTFVLEEFIAGDEWVVEGVCFGGIIQFFCVGAYSAPCLSIVTEDAVMRGERFDPVADEPVYRLVAPLLERALPALGLVDGVFHLELFHQAATGTVVFGECAARRGGGLTHEVVQCKFGVDLGEASVLCALGTDPMIKPAVRPGVVGSTFLATRPGVLVGYPSPEQIRQLPGIEHVRLELPFGSVVPDTTTTIQGVGQVVVTGDTRQEFRDRCDHLVRWFDERLIAVPTGASNQDLRTWQQTHWPQSAEFFRTYAGA